MKNAMGCFHSIARLMAYFLAGLLVFSLPLSILAHNSLRTLYSTNNISNAVVSLLLIRGGFREKLVDHIISDTWFDPASNAVSGILANLSPADRVEIAQILFPENWLKTQVQENINNLMNWFESEEPMPSFIIDLEPLRIELKQGGSLQIAEIWVDSLLACTNEQEMELEEALQRSNPIGDRLCKPREELRQRLVDFTGQQLLQKLEDMPSDISLLDQEGLENSVNTLDQLRHNILGFLLLMRWMRLLPFLFLGIIMTLVIRSWQDVRKWWGIPVGLGSLITLVVILLGNVVGPGALKDALSLSDSPIELQERIVNAIWELISTVLNRSAIQTFFLLIVAVIALILPILLSKRKGDSTVEPISEVSSGDISSDFPPPPQVMPFRPETTTDVNSNDSSNENTRQS
jgi:hypothetical protein